MGKPGIGAYMAGTEGHEPVEEAQHDWHWHEVAGAVIEVKAVACAGEIAKKVDAGTETSRKEVRTRNGEVANIYHHWRVR
jgi:hypothetical protein